MIKTLLCTAALCTFGAIGTFAFTTGCPMGAKPGICTQEQNGAGVCVEIDYQELAGTPGRGSASYSYCDNNCNSIGPIVAFENITQKQWVNDYANATSALCSAAANGSGSPAPAGGR